MTPSTSPTAAEFLANDVTRHGGRFNAEFTDTHAKSVAYQQSVGDVCLWTTDVEGPHPNCN